MHKISGPRVIFLEILPTLPIPVRVEGRPTPVPPSTRIGPEPFPNNYIYIPLPDPTRSIFFGVGACV